MPLRLDLPRLATAIVLIGVFAMAVRVPASPDMWWHLRCGEVQWRTGTVLKAEIFSHTAPGAPWINQSWLPQLALYALYTWGGFPALALAVGLLVAVTFGLVWLTSRARGGLEAWWAPYWRAGVVLWAAIASGPAWAARPHLLTLFFTALWVYLLERWRAGGQRIKDLVWLPPLMLLWANSHGGYVVGILLLLIEAGGLVLKALVDHRQAGHRDAPPTAQEAPPQSPPEAGGEEAGTEQAGAVEARAVEAGTEQAGAVEEGENTPARGRVLSPPSALRGNPFRWARVGEGVKAQVAWKSVLFVTMLCLIAATINPQGIHLLLFPFRTLSSVQQSAIAEWASPDFHARELWPFLGLLLAAWATLALSRPQQMYPQNAVSDLLRALCLTAMALRSSRYIGLAAVILAPLLVQHGAEVIASLLVPTHTRSGMSAHAAYGRPVMNWALLILVLLGAGVKVAQPLNAQTIDRVHRQQFPVDATGYLLSSDLPPELYNEYGWGGYLIWANARPHKGTGARVFIDGRADPYGDELIEAYQRIASTRPGWEETLQRYGVRTALIGANSALGHVLRESAWWREVYADEVAAIFVRETAR